MGSRDRIMAPEAPPVWGPGELHNMLLWVQAAPTKGDRRKAVAEIVAKIKISGISPLVAIIKDETDADILDTAQYMLMNDSVLRMFIDDKYLRGVVITWLVNLGGKGVEGSVRLQAFSNAQALLVEGPIAEDHAQWIRDFLKSDSDDKAVPLPTKLANVIANVLNAIRT